MTDDKMDCLSGAKSSSTPTEDDTEFKFVLMVATAVIALATVVLLPFVAQVFAFVVIVTWLKTKIFC